MTQTANEINDHHHLVIHDQDFEYSLSEDGIPRKKCRLNDSSSNNNYELVKVESKGGFESSSVESTNKNTQNDENDHQDSGKEMLKCYDDTTNESQQLLLSENIDTETTIDYLLDYSEEKELNDSGIDDHYHQSKSQHAVQKHHQQSTTASDETVCSNNDGNDINLRFLIRRREAGAIIGKKGANIRQLRDTFSSEFLIPDTGNGPERVLNISTNSRVIDQILKQLSELLHEKSLTIDGDEQVELRMLIHSSLAGSIIGKGGTSIRKLRDESKAAIKIFAMCCPLSNERVVAIKGKPSIVVTTIKLVLQVMSGCSIKGVVKLYDALHFEQTIADRYGGYSDDSETPSNGQFLPPQQLSPPPFMTNPFNTPPPNQFFPNGSYRLHDTPNNISPHRNFVPCKPVFNANQFPPHCTNCHYQRGQQCAHFVPHQHQLAYHQINQKCDNRHCSCYHQMAHHNNLGQNYVRHHSNTAHKFNRIRM